MLAMWVPELPFQLEGQRDSALKDRPLAFLSPEAGRTPTLWLVNRLAKKEGISAGDPLDHALHRLPGLRVLDPMPHIWWEAQSHLGEFLSQWSPQGLLGHCGEALLELKGTEGLFGPQQDVAWKIQKSLQRDIGWMAHGGLSLSATAARLASRLEHDIERVHNGFEATFLAPYALKNIQGLSTRLAWRLHRLGLRLLGDLQPIPLPTMGRIMGLDEARKVLSQARGEDQPRLPMLAEPPGRSSHVLRLEPPRLPEDVLLAPWCLERFWSEGRFPRQLQLRWWDMDGVEHQWQAAPDELTHPPLELAPAIERIFRQKSVRRILIQRIELNLTWGLGRSRSLFESTQSARLGRLEPTLARLRLRYPQTPVLPGWAR